MNRIKTVVELAIAIVIALGLAMCQMGERVAVP